MLETISPAHRMATGGGAGFAERHSSLSVPAYSQSRAENQPPRWKPCVCAPDEAIVVLRHDGGHRWTVNTPAGPLRLCTRDLLAFGWFRRRAALKLGLFLDRRPSADEWFRILNEAMAPLRACRADGRGPRACPKVVLS